MWQSSIVKKMRKRERKKERRKKENDFKQILLPILTMPHYHDFRILELDFLFIKNYNLKLLFLEMNVWLPNSIWVESPSGEEYPE